ncbi:MAG: FAD-dependent oxidoreductase [Clostridia bacterium]|nr:FAD-dependent oxidoreductase [Clostridia bacterium]
MAVVRETYDVIVVGAGLAGLYTALQLGSDLKILILSEGDISRTNSYLAQGGIATAIGEADDSEKHFADTMTCGHFVNDPVAVRVLVDEAVENIRTLEGFGVRFDADERGYKLGLEGAHAMARILRMGDHTGKTVLSTLYERVLERDNITHYDGAYVYRLIAAGGFCGGVEALIEETQRVFMAGSVVLATGGVGQLFSNTTNALGIEGTGIAMGIEAGVKTAGLADLQFHPTGLYGNDHYEGRHFLISEAVRGEGAILRDEKLDRFMDGVHPMKELAPRDVVSKTIHEVLRNQSLPYVYLDATHLDESFFRERFPTIYECCVNCGINPAHTMIPVVPCMHYYMGGLKTDLDGNTSLRGLYAVGECSHTGVHGKNRLASNSLLEALVFGRRAAKAILRNSGIVEDLRWIPLREVPYFNMSFGSLQNWMTRNMGVVKRYDEISNMRKKLEMALMEPSGYRLPNWEDLRLFHVSVLVHEMLIKTIEERDKNEV